MSKRLVLPLIVFSVWLQASDQITFSDSFQKMLKRLLKEQVRNSILDKMDPATSIFASDLIGELIENAHRDDIVRSSIRTGTTLMFVRLMKEEINKLIANDTSVLASARSMGFNRDELIAYSCLYFYYSELIKYRLYQRPGIVEMVKKKQSFERITVKDKKWYVSVSRDFITKRREEKLFLYDVRILNFATKFAIVALVDTVNKNDAIRQYFKELHHQYDSTDWSSLVDTFQLDSSLRIMSAVDSIIDKSDEAQEFGQKVFRLCFDEVNSKFSLTDRRSFEYALFSSFGSVAFSGYANNVETRDEIFKASVYFLTSLAKLASRQSTGFKYAVSLAGTSLLRPADIGSEPRTDFTVLDQCRLNLAIKDVGLFLFLGGVLDPILKSVLLKDSAKYYLFGAGISFKSFYLSISGGIPYPVFDKDDIRMGFTIGYEVPVYEIIGE